MDMRSLTISSSLNSIHIATILSALLFFMISPSCCMNPRPHVGNFRGFVVAAEKTRLGSRPPICRNKCNQCHPCMAVQVPTLPGQNHRVRPSSTHSADSSSTSAAGNRYSDYKPLGWKCRCDGHFYNP